LNIDVWVKSTLNCTSIVDVDTGFTQKATWTTELEKDFYTKISEELIDNDYDAIGMQAQTREDFPAAIDRGLARARLHAHLTPTKEVRDGTIINWKLQGK
jgi:hypothetical protein